VNGLQFLDSLDKTPRRLLVTIDLAALALAAVALVGARYLDIAEPEVILHGVWVCLAIEAFLFGLRVTLVRIVLATLFLVAYAALVDPKGVGTALEIEQLAVSDWPLMVVISVIIALMSDRVMRSARRYATLYRAASERLLTAQEDERRRLAQDLHDSVGQALTGLLLTLDATEKIAWPGDDERFDQGRETLHRAQDLAVAALADTRDVAWRLRPARLREAGLAGAIRELADKAGRPVELRIEADAGLPGTLFPDREIEVYRIVQEALGNAIHHAVASRVWIALERRPAGLFVQVGDDGRGFDPSAAVREGLGLAGMRERAIMLGTRLVVRSSSGKGSTIELVVPWEPAAARTAPDATRVPGPVT
jgi:two-component system, NarL family, sensor histidine kinase UhpB